MQSTDKAKLKRAQSLVGTSEGRDPTGADFYATPPYAVEELLKREKFEGIIWEPAAGTGNISKTLIRAGYEVISSDLIDRGYKDCISPVDFLTSSDIEADNIITNPPFSIIGDFIEKGLSVVKNKLVLLGKLQLLEGQKRKPMFESTPLESVYVFSKRLSMYRNDEKGDYSSSMICFAWFVWNKAYHGEPVIRWI